MLRRLLGDKQWSRQVPWQRRASATAVGIKQRAFEPQDVNDGTTSVAVKRKPGRPRKQVENADGQSVHFRPAGVISTPSARANKPSTSPGEEIISHDESGTRPTEMKRKPGRPRKVTDTSQTPESKFRSSAPRRKLNQVSMIPASLIGQASQHHDDLPSFLSYAARTELSASTTTYKGTHYEYTVASALESYGFELHRTGRANDLGIDLVGTFTLPSSTAKKKRGSSAKKAAVSASAAEIQVIAQCKAVQLQPAMVRELEGAYVGAPAGWKGDNVLALLVASGPATKGVRDALQRSRLPMALMQVTTEGGLSQFLWNAAAAGIGLEGLGVTLRHGGADTGAAGHRIALTWMGKVVEATKQAEEGSALAASRRCRKYHSTP